METAAGLSLYVALGMKGCEEPRTLDLVPEALRDTHTLARILGSLHDILLVAQQGEDWLLFMCVGFLL